MRSFKITPRDFLPFPPPPPCGRKSMYFIRFKLHNIINIELFKNYCATCHVCTIHNNIFVQGAGGSEVDFHFFTVSDGQLSGTFFRYEKILVSDKFIEFLNRENTYNNIACANFNNRSLPKNK